MYDKILNIQKELKVPKNQRNNFGNYNYRSCEDIVENAKPLCIKEGLVLTLSDEVIEVGGRVYVKATATLSDGANKIECTGMAREAESRKGMDDSQITGATSSYARKYALNGLFAIDDTRDADSINNHEEKAVVKKSPVKEAIEKLNQAKSLEELKEVYTKLPKALRDDKEVTNRKNELKEALNI